MTRAYTIALPLLLLWLLCWIAFSWGAVQDDAFIHLRYADNLHIHHFITYDGVHANSGASSLLYVSGLALLRGLSASPDLPHVVSSFLHLLLFGSLAALFVRVAITSETAGRAGLVFLLLLSTRSAVRWLDDGMETVAVVGLATLFAWVLHAEVSSRSASRTRSFALLLLSFLAVLLRIELSLMCVISFFLLLLKATGRAPSQPLAEGEQRWARFGSVALSSLYPLIGWGLGLVAIYSTMHFLLPDTAQAKSHGIRLWYNPLHDTLHTLAGAFSFGLGLLLFWLLTAVLLKLRNRVSGAGWLLANAIFPLLLVASVLRGQEIQGVRYFAWTFFFSTVWNILELHSRPAYVKVSNHRGWSDMQWLFCFAGLIFLTLPLESVIMRRVLQHRQTTLRVFESQRLEVLQYSRGVASDIGYIGYFTRASLCDLAGLVNGRQAGTLSSRQRIQACAATDPDFVFVNLSQLRSIAPALDLSGWQMCGSYDFTNVNSPDSHYLVVRPAIAAQACAATGKLPESVNTLLPPANVSLDPTHKGVKTQ